MVMFLLEMVVLVVGVVVKVVVVFMVVVYQSVNLSICLSGWMSAGVSDIGKLNGCTWVMD